MSQPIIPLSLLPSTPTPRRIHSIASRISVGVTSGRFARAVQLQLELHFSHRSGLSWAAYAITCPFDDHCIEQSPCLFCTAEARLFRPDDPIYDSASLVTGQTPDLFWNGNDECSESGQLWWTDQTENLLIGHEGVAAWQPFDSQHESVPSGDSNAEHFDFNEYFSLGLLTAPAHESQDCFPSGVSQSTNGALAEISQPPHTRSHGIQQPSPTPSSSSLVAHNDVEVPAEIYPSPASSPSPTLRNAESAIPSDSVLRCEEAPKGKREIDPMRATFVCPTCSEPFPNALCYRQHQIRHSCQAPTICHHCDRSFKYPKDLKRHLGQSKAAPSCPVLKSTGVSTKPFACLCESAAYTRKDSLQRHMDRENARGNGPDHRCIACQQRRCTCDANKLR
ncbi:hypothetical protein BKA63DRAFT_594103 [Paraphoma chrysanthemicola]|nr:hypothetical protein BKA63DRAFT_594103 [Paraphoma chrysanthemicola]